MRAKQSTAISSFFLNLPHFIERWNIFNDILEGPFSLRWLGDLRMFFFVVPQFIVFVQNQGWRRNDFAEVRGPGLSGGPGYLITKLNGHWI